MPLNMRAVISLYRLLVILFSVQKSRSGFEHCHHDPGDDPDEGIVEDLQYKWLGVLQYIHIERGTPEYFRVPRVVLVTRQHAVCVARDAALLPPGYALGNVIFEQYERDERECGLTLSELERGRACAGGVLSVPVADVLLHPHYQRRATNDSIALLQLFAPVISQYVLPICLPFTNDPQFDEDGEINKLIYHIDYLSVTPRDMMNEHREIFKISVLPPNRCHMKRDSVDSSATAVMCTSSCDFHSGAPSVAHERTGHWSLLALALGGPPCEDPLRPSQSTPPARHILIHPYVEWIVNTITGVPQGSAKDDPFGFSLSRAVDSPAQLPRHKRLREGWLGHWWLAGDTCYYRGNAARNMYRFYRERFRIYPEKKELRNYYIEIFAPPGAAISCVKVDLPYQVLKPDVRDLGTSTVKLNVPIIHLSEEYKFHVEAWAVNDTSSFRGETQFSNS